MLLLWTMAEEFPTKITHDPEPSWFQRHFQTVTPLSRTLTVLLFITLPFFSFLLGYGYGLSEPIIPDSCPGCSYEKESGENYQVDQAQFTLDELLQEFASSSVYSSFFSIPTSTTFSWRQSTTEPEVIEISGRRIETSDLPFQARDDQYVDSVNHLDAELKNFFTEAKGFDESSANDADHPTNNSSTIGFEHHELNILCLRSVKDAVSEFISYTVGCGVKPDLDLTEKHRSEMLHDKYESWGPCPGPEASCFERRLIYSDGIIEIIDYQGTTTNELGGQFVMDYLALVEKLNVLEKTCESPTLPDYRRIDTLSKRKSPISYPGCESELKAIDNLIETYQAGVDTETSNSDLPVFEISANGKVFKGQPETYCWDSLCVDGVTKDLPDDQMMLLNLNDTIEYELISDVAPINVSYSVREVVDGDWPNNPASLYVTKGELGSSTKRTFTLSDIEPGEYILVLFASWQEGGDMSSVFKAKIE